MKYHLIYMTTNLINGISYIGKHSTTNLNDGYKGSGTNLKKAFKEFGKDNFHTEIIFCALTEIFAYEIEEELIVLNENCYNIILGGKRKSFTQGIKFSESWRANISKAKTGANHPLFGKKHSEETKLKMSIAHKGHQRHLNFTRTEEQKIRISKSHEKYNYQIKIPSGVIIHSSNLKKFCKEESISLSSMKRNGKVKGYEIVSKTPM